MCTGDDATQTVGILGVSKRPETMSKPIAEGTDEVFVRVVNQQLFEAIRIDRGDWGDDFEQMWKGLEDFSDIMMSIITSRHRGNRR